MFQQRYIYRWSIQLHFTYKDCKMQLKAVKNLSVDRYFILYYLAQMQIDFPFGLSNSEGTLVGKCLYCNLLTVESAV